MSTHYRLPNYEITKDVDDYVAAWRELCRPLEGATGMKHIAFDPDVQFVNADGTLSIDLPIWFIRMLNDALDNLENVISSYAD